MTFIKVQCGNCDSTQVMFSKATTAVNCNACSGALSTPAGGKAQLFGKFVEQL